MKLPLRLLEGFNRLRRGCGARKSPGGPPAGAGPANRGAASDGLVRSHSPSNCELLPATKL
jgi:hypothetical protein